MISLINTVVSFILQVSGGLMARWTIYYKISDFDRRLMQLIYTLGMFFWDLCGLPDTQTSHSTTVYFTD